MNACDAEPKRVANPSPKRHAAVLSDSLTNRLLAYGAVAGAACLGASRAQADDVYETD
jgi:hypothetical protein